MCIRPLIVKLFPAFFPSTNVQVGSRKTPSAVSSRLQTWGMGIGSSLRASKIWWYSASRGTQMTRSEEEYNRESQSAKTIIIQGNNESERSLRGIELEERGCSPSTLARSEIGEFENVEIAGKDSMTWWWEAELLIFYEINDFTPRCEQWRGLRRGVEVLQNG